MHMVNRRRRAPPGRRPAPAGAAPVTTVALPVLLLLLLLLDVQLAAALLPGGNGPPESSGGGTFTLRTGINTFGQVNAIDVTAILPFTGGAYPGQPQAPAKAFLRQGGYCEGCGEHMGTVSVLVPDVSLGVVLLPTTASVSFPRDSQLPIHVGGYRMWMGRGDYTGVPEYHVAVGGHGDESAATRVTIFDKLAGTISAMSLTDYLEEVGHSGSDIGDCAVVFGGQRNAGGNYVSDLEVINTTSMAYTRISGVGALASPRAFASAATCSTHAVVYGGWDGSSLQTDTHLYDVSTFSVANPVPPVTMTTVARAETTSAATGDRVFIIGGSADGFNTAPLNLIEVIDPVARTVVKTYTDMPRARSTPTQSHRIAFAVSDRYLVFGGGCSSAAPWDSNMFTNIGESAVDILDFQSDTWYADVLGNQSNIPQSCFAGMFAGRWPDGTADVFIAGGEAGDNRDAFTINFNPTPTTSTSSTSSSSGGTSSSASTSTTPSSTSSSPPTEQASSSPSEGDDDTLLLPIIIGAVACCLLVLCCLVLAILFVRRRRNKDDSFDHAEPGGVVELQTPQYESYPNDGTSPISPASYGAMPVKSGGGSGGSSGGATPPTPSGAQGYSSLPAGSMGSSPGATDHVSLISARLTDNKYIIRAEDLAVLEQVGAGAYGTVHRGEWNGTDCAVKIVSAIDQGEYEDFVNEIQLMAGMKSHPNVLALYGYSVSPSVMLVSEFMAKGSLDALLSSPEMTDARAVPLIQGIAKGMLHLASEKVVHKDLACRNVLVSSEWQPKVADFGLARAIEDTHTTKSNTGPLKWLAPESLSEKVFSEKSDVWMFSVTCVELLTRSPPYALSHADLKAFDIASDVGRRKLKPYSEEVRAVLAQPISNVLAQVLSQCCEYDPADRPSFKEIVRSTAKA